MSLEISITVAVTSLIQSIFGVGVLLFGTPMLLALGHDFISAITTLLPISLAINLLQIAKDYKEINGKFFKNIVFHTIPFVVIFLFLAITSRINIGMTIGVFLLFISLKDYSKHVKTVIDFSSRYERVYFVGIGIVHGMTNLGGALLTAFAHSKNYEKSVTRVTVAASYATFAIFQIFTLWFSGNLNDIDLTKFGVYFLVGVLTFLITEATIYMEISSQRYSNFFSVRASALCKIYLAPERIK